jgi:hypothetical protein
MEMDFETWVPGSESDEEEVVEETEASRREAAAKIAAAKAEAAMRRKAHFQKGSSCSALFLFIFFLLNIFACYSASEE